MTRISALVWLIIVGLCCSAIPLSEPLSGYQIAQKMFDRAADIHSLTYTISKQERVEGKLTKQISFTKMQKDPYRVYLRQSFPNDGMEVLYVQGDNNNKALINPNGFPWLNLKLNPMDGIMRNNQHHTIFQSGFDHVVSILEYLCEKYQDEIGDMVIYNGIVDQQGRPSYSISFSNPYFQIIDYTVLKDETIEGIADKYKLSAYMILEQNPSIKDYEDVSEGQVIKIPNDYSPKLHLAIDTADLVPLKMEVHDDQGLYEMYEYSQVNINPEWSEKEFSSDNEGYGF